MIVEKYYWSRIKEMVSDVIWNCGECKDVGKIFVGNYVGIRIFVIVLVVIVGIILVILVSNVVFGFVILVEKVVILIFVDGDNFFVESFFFIFVFL